MLYSAAVVCTIFSFNCACAPTLSLSLFSLLECVVGVFLFSCISAKSKTVRDIIQFPLKSLFLFAQKRINTAITMKLSALTAAGLALLSLGAPTALAANEVSPVPANMFSGLDKGQVCSLPKNLADKAAEDMSKGAQSIDIGPSKKGLLKKDQSWTSLAQWESSLLHLITIHQRPDAAWVSTLTRRAQARSNGADIDIKYAFLGQCKAPYDLSSALLSNNGLLKFNLKNGIDIACKDAENCKCAAITSKLEYSASFDEKAEIVPRNVGSRCAPPKYSRGT